MAHASLSPLDPALETNCLTSSRSPPAATFYRPKEMNLSVWHKITYDFCHVLAPGLHRGVPTLAHRGSIPG